MSNLHLYTDEMLASSLRFQLEQAVKLARELETRGYMIHIGPYRDKLNVTQGDHTLYIEKNISTIKAI